MLGNMHCLLSLSTRRLQIDEVVVHVTDTDDCSSVFVDFEANDMCQIALVQMSNRSQCNKTAPLEIVSEIVLHNTLSTCCLHLWKNIFARDEPIHEEQGERTNVVASFL